MKRGQQVFMCCSDVLLILVYMSVVVGCKCMYHMYKCYCKTAFVVVHFSFQPNVEIISCLQLKSKM